MKNLKKAEVKTNASLNQPFLDPEHGEKRADIVSKEKLKLLGKSFGHQQREKSCPKLAKSEDVTVVVKSSVFFKEDLENIIDHCGNCPSDKKKKVKEGWFGPRGSTGAKLAARAGGIKPAGPVAGSPADRAAKMAAFEKQKAAWAAQKKAQSAALPPEVAARKRARMAANEAMSVAIDSELPPSVQKQRRPVTRPGEEKTPLMQGHYPRVGAGSATRSALN